MLVCWPPGFSVFFAADPGPLQRPLQRPWPLQQLLQRPWPLTSPCNVPATSRGPRNVPPGPVSGPLQCVRSFGAVGASPLPGCCNSPCNGRSGPNLAPRSLSRRRCGRPGRRRGALEKSQRRRQLRRRRRQGLGRNKEPPV